MIYTTYYTSPLGQLLLAAKEDSLIGLWIEGQKSCLSGFSETITENEKNLSLIQVCSWLDQYFAGEKPPLSRLRVAPFGSAFQQEVWRILCKIPYGCTITYGDIARKIAIKRGMKRMSAQAVGGAVGHNPVSIVIPCHRVVGANGNLTGYTGGMDKKIWLLTHERIDMQQYFVPKKLCKGQAAR